MIVSLPQAGLSMAAGGLTTLSPCVFPLLPLVLGGAMQANRWAPVAMGVGMAASFAAIGMLIGAAGPALGIESDVVRLAGAWLLIGFAVGVGVAWGFVLPPLEAGVVIVECSMPVAVFNYLFALRYNRSPEAVAGSVVLSTVIGFCLLPLLLWLVLSRMPA